MVTLQCSVRNFNVNNFRKLLSQSPWSVIDVFGNIDDMWNAWQQLFIDAVNNVLP